MVRGFFFIFFNQGWFEIEIFGRVWVLGQGFFQEEREGLYVGWVGGWEFLVVLVVIQWAQGWVWSRDRGVRLILVGYYISFWGRGYSFGVGGVERGLQGRFGLGFGRVFVGYRRWFFCSAFKVCVIWFYCFYFVLVIFYCFYFFGQNYRVVLDFRFLFI